jgi:asparagine synthase (glutamine-hydrolysing)
MCGIFGYKGKIEQELGLKCLRTLAHRGPDGEGIYQTDGIFLGHRRLAILDLSERGKQPMSYLEGRYWITFNGEIYNFVEIKKELSTKGYRFQSESDTEVVLAAYVEWGEKCLDKFNGMWAFVIWDREKKELFLSRDRFGKKPLFYSFIDDDFVFASEMKAIAPLLERVEPDIDIIRDISHIFDYESTDKCLIKGIKRFPAGNYGRLKDGKLELVRYWCTLDNLVDVPPTYEEQTERFKELFLDACKIRMRSDVPIGTALSGGLDSSATLCALKHQSRNQKGDRVARDWQHAFCASFPGTPIDEVEWAKKVADYCGTKINIIEIDPEKYLNDFYEHIYLFEDLYITPHIPFVATYKEMRKNGVVVTLDGHGGDELFGGYHFDYLHILHDTMFNLKNSLAVINTYYNANLVDGIQFRHLPPRGIFLLQQFVRNAGKKILRYKNKNVDDNHPKWRTLDYLTQKLYISFHQTTLPTLLRNYDRYSMINGVEIRMPFMDHRLVAYAFSLPWTSKIRNGYTKAIVRDALSEIMPVEVAYRKTKVGFNSPMVDWFKGPMKTFFLETVESQEFKNNLIVDPVTTKERIMKTINDPNASFADATAAWKMISPVFWFKGFLHKACN